jgi:hypothetical protein
MEAIFPYIVSGLSILFAGIAFFKSNHKDSTGSGERWGRLETTLEFIQKEIKSLGEKMDKNEKSHNEDLEKIRQTLRNDVNKLHDRINKHLRQDHGINLGGDKE